MGLFDNPEYLQRVAGGLQGLGQGLLWKQLQDQQAAQREQARQLQQQQIDLSAYGAGLQRAPIEGVQPTQIGAEQFFQIPAKEDPLETVKIAKIKAETARIGKEIEKAGSSIKLMEQQTRKTGRQADIIESPQLKDARKTVKDNLAELALQTDEFRNIPEEDLAKVVSYFELLGIDANVIGNVEQRTWLQKQMSKLGIKGRPERTFSIENLGTFKVSDISDPNKVSDDQLFQLLSAIQQENQ